MSAIGNANQYPFVPQDLKGGALVEYSDGKIWMNNETGRKFLIPLDWQQQPLVQIPGFNKPVKVKQVYACPVMTMSGLMPEEEKVDLYDPKTMQKIYSISAQTFK